MLAKSFQRALTRPSPIVSRLFTDSNATVREALQSAMHEELARDPNVYVMGEEVGQYMGAYKVTKGKDFFPLNKKDLWKPMEPKGFGIPQLPSRVSLV